MSRTDGKQHNRVTRSVAVSVLLAMVGACADANSPTAVTDGQTEPTAHSRLTNRKARWVQLGAEVTTMPCVVVDELADGTYHLGYISPRNAPIPLPRLDSVFTDAPRPTLTPVVTRTTAGSRALTVACITSASSASGLELRQHLERRDAAVRNAVEWTARGRLPATGAVPIVSDALREQLVSAGVARGLSVTEPLDVAPPAGRPLKRPQASVTGARSTAALGISASWGGWPQSLPAVVIIAAPTYWYIDHSWLLRAMNSRPDFDPTSLTTQVQYMGSDCASASEYWLAVDAALQKIAEEGELKGASSNALLSWTCEPVSGKSLCIDFFIAADRAFIFGGDNRTFNPEAGIRDSRVHVYVNPQTLDWEVKINSTRIDAFGIHRTKADSVDKFRPEDVEITPLANGAFAIDMTFYNNWCLMRTGCPSIDAVLVFSPNAAKPGGYDVAWIRDGFPSMGVYGKSSPSESWQAIREDPERIRNQYLNWIALLSVWRNLVNLPNGCNMQ